MNSRYMYDVLSYDIFFADKRHQLEVDRLNAVSPKAWRTFLTICSKHVWNSRKSTSHSVPSSNVALSPMMTQTPKEMQGKFGIYKAGRP